MDVIPLYCRTILGVKLDNVRLSHLVASVSDIAHDVFVDHVVRNKEFLSYVYIEEVAMRLFERWPASRAETVKVVQLLESVFVDYDDEVGEIIVVSFIEGISSADWKRLGSAVSIPKMSKARSAMGFE